MKRQRHRHQGARKEKVTHALHFAAAAVNGQPTAWRRRIALWLARIRVVPHNPANVRILIVEDNDKTAGALKTGLQNEKFEVTTTPTGEEGFFLLNSQPFDLVVLDWMLPGRDGLEILKAVRAQEKKIPVLLLTARDTVEDRVRGLESGADDYLVKPFAFAELVARIRSLLRRAAPADPLRKQIGDLRVDLETRRVWREDKPIELTPREFDLLAYLWRQPGQVVTREMLARDVWRETNRASPLDNVIDVHVGHLRRKIDEGRARKMIHTVRGLGFALREEAGR
jgi:two-component system copper resistance phosphate regulon response regulator CusR